MLKYFFISPFIQLKKSQTFQKLVLIVVWCIQNFLYEIAGYLKLFNAFQESYARYIN